jgi:hypothetical protein
MNYTIQPESLKREYEYRFQALRNLIRSRASSTAAADNGLVSFTSNG